MAGIALVLNLAKKNSAVHAQPVHAHHLFSATLAVSAAAASAAASWPFASRSIFGNGGIPIAYCDAGAALSDSYIPNIPTEELLSSSVTYRPKEYPVELKSLTSAFGLKSLALTSVRSFLLFYLPLLEPHPPVEGDNDDLEDPPENKSVDLVTPFKKSVKQIARETTVVTVRRVLERLAVHYVSQRMAWKLLKDVPRSAKRKAARDISTPCFVFSVSRTTFRGHMLGVAASWIVQIGVDAYRCFIRKSEDDPLADKNEKIRLFGKKVYATTIKCTASLVFASIGAGICALIHPSTGQWVGCALGDFAGPVIAIICFEKLHLEI
ncbi:uncharacterized protein LOC120274702 [Dioscorea cayenensis subsp. rotundata]|uniref:Uncharacterized protein LOC120274702 n=1 Tax=Dioscorea cayennensis subsp. rotundata TaxID=55577 RepID=A0AB40CEI8_DIOCR|nr:uncharacterized protein LOC120274702 [Dioscorea cayenensis subsp. rotundata]